MDTNPPDTDDAAMRRLQLGEDEALDEIMGRWQQAAARFLLRLLGDPDDAMDLAQETFVRIYEHRARYRPGSSFRAWLFTIASNLARNHLRWRARHPTRRLDAPPLHAAPTDGSPADPGPSPDREIQRRETALAVRQAIGELPEDLRVAIVLSEYEGLRQEEIAGVLRCSRKAVETRLYRARAKLRNALRAVK